MKKLSLRRRSRRAGLTLLEIMVSSAILAGLTLVLMASMVPMSNTSSESGVILDMDRAANRVLIELRRELRQSGYDGTNVMFGSTALGDGNLDAANNSATIVYRKRATATTWETTPSNLPNAISWGLVDDGDARTGSHLVRTENGLPVRIITSWVDEIRFIVPDNDQRVEVRLTLVRESPWETDPVTHQPKRIYRRYVELIDMMNRRNT